MEDSPDAQRVEAMRRCIYVYIERASLRCVCV